VGDGRETPLHAAARRGPLALVEMLIAGGALEWDADAAGRTPLDVARRGRASDRAAIVALLDRTTYADASFRAAVAAVHAGDVATLARLLDAEPRLLRERIVEPDAYREAARTRHRYFLEPKLFWFVANNPTLVERMPGNITEIARAMLERGVERPDLDYTLELTMTSAAAREGEHQRPLMAVLLAAGAEPTRDAVVMTAGYRELDALQALLDTGRAASVPIAAAFGDTETLAQLLADAGEEDVALAFGLAVINERIEAARLALDNGADVNAFLPVHTHGTALHTAAIYDNVALIEMLLARGARTDLRDKLWDGTPLDWALHEGKPAATTLLQNVGADV